ncbi:MAG: HAD-IIIA family hydrolase [Rickettsiales bacterium]|jgi:phosphoglycolate phosphatase|nr:HAD-IIIA family hydrolase [Rickettsiales bacterium]
MKDYKLLIFDWDGTLVDSEDLLVESIKKTAINFDCIISEVEINKYIGLSLKTIHQQLFSTIKYPIFCKVFYQHYNEDRLGAYFFTGAIATMNHLKEQGFTLAIATNKSRAKLEMVLDKAKIQHLFAATQCPDDGFPKPNPKMLITLLDELNYEHEDALVIGDTIFDMQFAQNAKVAALAACYGYHTKEQLAVYNPVGFIDDIQDLKKVLVKYHF